MHPMLYEIPEWLPDPNGADAPNEVRTSELLPQRLGPVGPNYPKPHGLWIERIYRRQSLVAGGYVWEPVRNKHLEKYLEEEFGDAAN